MVGYEPGDDGTLQKGVAWPNPRFTDNGNGTVTDNLTGLIWLKQVNCFNTKSWIDALSAANTLASGSCGLTDNSNAGDWRVPNISELSSLISIASLNPALPNNPFTSRSSYYWSSSTFAEVTDNAWIVYLDMGYVDTVSKKSMVNLWPVRGGNTNVGTVKLPKTGQTVSHAAGDDSNLRKGAAWPFPRFTNNGNGTVTDNLTGLVWLKNASCLEETIPGKMMTKLGLMSWVDALAWTSALASGSCGLADGSRAGDWRVPNRNELLSLIDRSRANPALPAGHSFDNVQLDGYWSSSSLLPYDNNTTPVTAWYVYLGNGVVSVNDSIRDYTSYVWPVRDRSK
jgi:hypothetical protein